MKWLVFPLLLWSAFVFADPLPPDALIKQTTERALAELEEKRSALEQEPEKLYQLVNEILLPHVDFEHTARLILGRHWRTADAAQRQRFIDEFKTLLLRTYAAAVFEYDGEKISYKPFRMNDGDTIVTVHAQIQSRDGLPIPFQYALAKSESGDWKVFDIAIDGISLVTNYRTSYGRLIREKGMDVLLDTLADKNKQLIQ